MTTRQTLLLAGAALLLVGLGAPREPAAGLLVVLGVFLLGLGAITA